MFMEFTISNTVEAKKKKKAPKLSLEANSFEICLKEFLEAEPLWQTAVSFLQASVL